ncbi:D-alanyl-D-alanine carboxypeptidase family protein [Halotalea alkalilenta]|uniref:D-alanyl-D-alanine carboxypeptidase family protein n=1 Tax=Halotalea alkalilenta TaxID=376489 RepID=UPI0009EE0A33|nr:D-alanyl-D-alanine carboxypeptidase family protein [Halotalea alkalilenta]
MILHASPVRRWRRLTLVALFGASTSTVLFVATSAIAQAPTPDAQPTAGPTLNPLNMVPAPPSLAATSWVLMDAKSGDIILEQNAHQRLPPASLTKLMTAYIAEYEIEAGRLNESDMARVSENAWRTGGSRMFLNVNTNVSIGDLMRGIVVQSGNDASVAMAEHIAGSEDAFAQLMNQHAQMLGMKNTHFMNATGLPHDEHYTSAYDLADLSRHIILDFPEHYSLYEEREFTYNGIRQPNRNLLLWRDGRVDGLKTGHTEAAGYCLAASAVDGDTRLIAVVMGTNSEEARAQETMKLLSYGFRYYHTQRLFDAGHVVSNARVWGGSQNNVPVGFPDEVYVTLPQGDGELTQRVELSSDIEAPVAAGQELGTLTVMRGDDEIATRPLVALEAVEEGGFIKQAWDKLVRFVTSFF